MKRTVMGLMAVATLMFAFAAVPSVHGEDKPAKPAKVFVYVPYSKLTDLSEDQKKQISAIQAEYKARKEMLEVEEDAKIAALLTDGQKQALAKLDTDAAAKRAEKAKMARDKKKEDKAGEEKK